MEVVDSATNSTEESPAGGSFETIAHAAVKAQEGSAKEDTPTGTAASAVTDEGTSADEAATEAPEVEMRKMLDEAGGEAMKLDPEKVPESLRPFLKSFQADYTRKTQAIADAEKARAAQEAAGAPADEVEQLRQKVASLEAQASAAPVAQAEGDPDIKVLIEKGVEQDFGPLITYEAMAASENPDDLRRYLQQQIALGVRTSISEYHSQVTAPRISGLEEGLRSTVEAEREAAIGSYFNGNPELAPYADTLIAPLIEAGMTLEQAGEAVRAAVGNAQQQGLALGVQVGQQKANQVNEAKDRFSVPSGSTAARSGSPAFTPDMSFESIGKAAFEAQNG